MKEWVKQWIDRLSPRLVISHVSVAVLVLAVALGISRVTFQQYLVSSQKQILLVRGEEIAHVMHGYFTGTLYGATATYLVRVLQGTLNERVYVLDNTGQILLETSNIQGPSASLPARVLRSVLISGKTFQGILFSSNHESMVACGVPVLVNQQVAGGIFLEAPLANSNQTANSLTGLLLAGELAAVILAGALAYAISRHLAKPLEALRLSVAKMGDRVPKTRAAVEGPSEVKALAREFNSLADRVEAQVVQLEREAQARDQLMAHVAHDLRTPLTSIRGFLEAVKDGVAQGDRRDRAIEVAWQETLRLKRLVDRLLTATRIRSGTGTKTPLHVRDWIQSTLERMEPIAQEKMQRIRWSAQDDAVISGVEDYLLEALINVLENAVKWSPRGSTIDVASRLSAERDRIEILVHDQGPGIAEDLLPRVFERFVTGDASRSGSSGLGLAIVDEVVRYHQGRVWVTNHPTGGALVTMEFPVATDSSG